MIRRPPRSTLFPSPTLSRSMESRSLERRLVRLGAARGEEHRLHRAAADCQQPLRQRDRRNVRRADEHSVDRAGDRKSTRLNSSHDQISYAVFCLKKKKNMLARRLRKDDNNHIILDGIITSIICTIQMINVIRSRDGTRNRRRLKANHNGEKLNA